MRCSRDVLLGRIPGADPGHNGEMISLVWEHHGVPMEVEEVGEGSLGSRPRLTAEN